MTGTPVANSLRDVWGISDLTVPGVFGPTLKRFGGRYMGALTGEFGPVYPKGPAGRTNLSELTRRLSAFMVEVPAKIVQAQLPPRRFRMTSIPVDQQELRGWGLREIGQKIHKLAMSKAWNGADLRQEEVDYDQLDAQKRTIMDQISELRVEEAAARKAPFALEKILEFLEHGAGKRKVLAFVGRQRLCEKLGTVLAKKAAKLGAKVWWAHGAAYNDQEREQIRQEYMAHPGPCALVVTYQAFGMGLNLQDTDYMPVVQLPFTPEELEQLIGRGRRLGQARPLLVEFFKALKTVDEQLFSLVLEKLPAVEAIAGAANTLDGLLDVFNRVDGRQDRLKALAKTLGSWFRDVQNEPEMDEPQEDFPQ
jgi:hypothetical protein